MSLGIGLSSALSGLTVNARQAEIVSSNIANAQTEGYGRREVDVSVRMVGSSGQGAQVNGIRRIVDQVVLGDRRLAGAGAAGRETIERFHAGVEQALGLPTDPSSLSGRLAAFDSALVEAASRPDSEPRLAAVLDAGRGLAQTLAAATGTVQDARMRADAAIASQVDRLNSALRGVGELNARILALDADGRDASALMDQRQQLVDGISDLVPLREIARPGGQIALYTQSGATLIDGVRPAVFEFRATPVITADMTLGSGALSGLTLNGRPVATGAANGGIAGGALAAAFAVRDELAPAAQARLDGFARDLMTRLADPALDPTLAPGDPGLFTDAGAAFDPGREPGLAGRLRINAAADPAAGGGLWRLRDGLGAATPGPAGDPRLLTALHDALADPRPTASGGFSAAPRSAAVLAAELVSGISAARLTAETEATFSRARAEALRVMELDGGVDTDRELQDLLVIEKAYAANARVLSTVDEMISLLLGL
jgi:flagellar hook-associated protein 1 FlgK